MVLNHTVMGLNTIVTELNQEIAVLIENQASQGFEWGSHDTHVDTGPRLIQMYIKL